MPKKKGVPYRLKPGEARYLAEVTKPGMKKVEAARRAGLDYVPHRQAIEDIRRKIIHKQLELADITINRVVMELARVAFFDPAGMFDENGNLKRIIDMDRDTRAAIQGFDVEQRMEGRGEDAVPVIVLKPRTYNKNQALEILTRMKQLPGESADQGGPMAMPSVVVNFVDSASNSGTTKSLP